MNDAYKGIVGAPTTPFNSDNEVDLDIFGKQVNFLIESGVNLIAHPMHIGESLNLSEEERKNLAEVLVDASGGRVPTFVHVSSGGTDNSAIMAEHATRVGNTGIVLMAPYHWAPKPQEILNHFVTVMKASEGKLIAYNNPRATNVNLTHDLVATFIEEIPGFVALKDATFHMETFGKFCSLSSKENDHFAVYTGIEHLLTSVPVGGYGCFSACSEVAPKLVQDLFNACSAADYEVARNLQYKMWRLLTLLMTDYPATIKYCMELMGRPIGGVRSPIRTINKENRAHAKSELDALNIFNTEKHGW
jgi:4-hydroxy-tetrahydrodipicolinate synthase